MADERTVVIGIYPNYTSLESGVQALKNAGFRNSDVSVLYPEKRKPGRSTDTTGKAARTAPDSGSGTMVGGVLGWLAGAGSLVIPGIAPLIAVGPVVGSFMTAAGSAAIANGLVALGLPEADAREFDGCLKEGCTLLSVHPDNDYWATRAREMMGKSGAQRIATAGRLERRT